MWVGTVDADGSAPGHLPGHLSYRPAATTVISMYAKEVKFLVYGYLFPFVAVSLIHDCLMI